MPDFRKGKPTGVRLSALEKRQAKQAALLESHRLQRRVGWTTLVREGGMTKVKRILRAAQVAQARAS